MPRRIRSGAGRATLWHGSIRPEADAALGWGGRWTWARPWRRAAVLAILIVAAVVIRLAHVFVASVARALLNRENLEGTAQELSSFELKKRQDTIEALGVNVIRFFVLVVAGLMILQAGFKLDIGPAIAGLGIAGIAIGLGTQHLVRDYLNGALILIENQYAKGDIVRIAGVSGKVEDFTLRRTTLRDQDGTVHTVPNGEITVASNMTRVWARVIQDVQVVYGTNIENATASSIAWAGSWPRIRSGDRAFWRRPASS